MTRQKKQMFGKKGNILCELNLAPPLGWQNNYNKLKEIKQQKD
jgi:hypothetical protein